jgi:hypothetical protein
MPLAASFAIVGAGFLLLAGVLGLLAWRSFKKVEPPHRTIEGAKATADVLKNARPRPATPAERAALER